MYPLSVFRGVEWEDFVAFVDENIDADCWIYVFVFKCVREFEREIESDDVQFVKVFSIVVEFIGVLIYSVNMRENAP